MKEKSSFRIHPSIGISRVGNSPEYNLAPETFTGEYDADSKIIGGLPIVKDTENQHIMSSDLRDKTGALRRQAARFRIFHYPETTNSYPTNSGEEIKIGSEIKGYGKVVDIIWTVHLANKKTAGPVLENPNLKYSKKLKNESDFSDGILPYIDGYKDGTNPYRKDEKNVFPPLRNPSFTGDNRYNSLIIDPGPRAISAKEDSEIHFDRSSVPTYGNDKGKIISAKNYHKVFPQDLFDDLYCPSGQIQSLGSAVTDKSGRLIVAAAYGKAVSWSSGQEQVQGNGTPLISNTDNDGWFDDTSDGPVYATLVFEGGKSGATTVEAENAWVVCTDPAYAPQVLNSVSLWDELYDTFVRKFNLIPDLFNNGKFNPKYKVNFQQDIQPFLQSANLQQWTTNLPLNAVTRHNAISNLRSLKDFKYKDFIRRSSDSMSQSKMPLSLGDSGEAFLTPTETQDHHFQIAFEQGEQGDYKELGPGEKLDRASLMNCLGGRFSPGIDMTFIVRQEDLYHNDWKSSGPFRIHAKRMDYEKSDKDKTILGEGYLPYQNNSQGIEPGDTSKFMALPWHTDYNSCAVHNPSVPPANPKTMYWSWPAQRPYAVRIADEAQSIFTFTPQGVSQMIHALGKKVIGVNPSLLLPVLQNDDNVQAILAINAYNEHSCKSLLIDNLESIKDSENMDLEPYIDFMMSFVQTQIDSPYRLSVRGKDSSGTFGDMSGNYFDSINMVKNWADIGVVIQGKAIDTSILGKHNDQYLLEAASRLQVREDMEEIVPWPEYPAVERHLYYGLQNVDTNPNVVPKARMYTENVLKGAWQYANGMTADGYQDTIDSLGKFFPYSKESYRKRLDDVYRSLANTEEGYDPATDPLFKSRNECYIRILQLAPYNLADGAWLRNINNAGPISEVRALLASVEEDERGNGDPSMNHCNIYLDLCHSVGFYPHAVDSLEFAMDPRFEDSAFSVAAFELSISQFTESYFPEILGMTLFLEWSVLELKNTIKLFDYYNINSHFYTMHVGIDNATNGHGQRAKDAIEVYLDAVLSMSGEKAMDETWKRIWTGYVAFGYWGSGGADVFAQLSIDPNSKEELHKSMVALIREKSQYGIYNHDQNKLGGRLINDWFADPDGFLIELQKAGYIIPGDVKSSRFFQLLEFETGKMFRIFTDDEIQLWKDWTNSLGTIKPDPKPTDPEKNMIEMIKILNQQQIGNMQHANITIKGRNGVPKSIAEWFKGAEVDFMDALANEENGWVIPGNANESLFVTQLMSETNKMGVAVSGVIPNTGGKTGRDIAIEWIDSLKPKETEHLQTLISRPFLSSLHQHHGKKPIIRGQGTIH